jgi:hypothetical protein
MHKPTYDQVPTHTIHAKTQDLSQIPVCNNKNFNGIIAINQNELSSQLSVALVIHLAQIHIMLMSLSIPLLLCIPDGCTFPQGNIRMISDGFKANSAASTALWGSGIAWVTAVRYLGISTSSIRYAVMAHMCIPFATYSAFLTLRYDTYEELHVLFAVVWITSSFLFHFFVTIQNAAQKSLVAQYIFWIGVFLGLIFVFLFIGVQSTSNKLIDDMKITANLEDVQVLSTIALLEVLTVFSLMVLDFILCGMMLNTFAYGESLLVIISHIDSRFYRTCIQFTIFAVFVMITIAGVVTLIRVL